MSDDFIPLNQSTPVQRQWNQGRNQNYSLSGFRNNFQNGKRGGRQQWGNNSRNNSYSSDNNSYGNNSYSNNSYGNNGYSNNSYGNNGNGNNSCSNNSYNRSSIDAYLHPSMLVDPWAQLRQKRN